MDAATVNDLIADARPLTPEGADFVLDLRELLLTKGHAGSCVQCFFGLLGDLNRPGSLLPLRHWLEAHLEVAVKVDGETREPIPFAIGTSKNLNEYCKQIFSLIREDRRYDEEMIRLNFQYRKVALS